MKVSHSYTFAEFLELYTLINRAVSQEMPADLPSKLVLACIARLRLRLAKRLLVHRQQYTFAWEIDEQMAFAIAYQEGLIYSGNTWSSNILLQTFNKLHPNL